MLIQKALRASESGLGGTFLKGENDCTLGFWNDGGAGFFFSHLFWNFSNLNSLDEPCRPLLCRLFGPGPDIREQDKDEAAAHTEQVELLRLAQHNLFPQKRDVLYRWPGDPPLGAEVPHCTQGHDWLPDAEHQLWDTTLVTPRWLRGFFQG